MIRNGIKTDRLEFLGGLGPEMIENETKMVPKFTIWSIWATLGPK